MSRILAETGDIVVQGLLLVDSPNFSATHGQDSIATKDLPQVVSSSSPRIRTNILASMARAQEMISDWHPPQWGTKKSPPAVLIRATDHVPVPLGSRLKATVDLGRDDPRLGWEAYPVLDILSVLDVRDAHHFNMFSLSSVC
jgi:hypothetical protein